VALSGIGLFVLPQANRAMAHWLFCTVSAGLPARRRLLGAAGPWLSGWLHTAPPAAAEPALAMVLVASVVSMLA
jgi:hypothetical protein